MQSGFLGLQRRLHLSYQTTTLAQAISLNADRRFERGAILLIDRFGLPTFEVRTCQQPARSVSLTPALLLVMARGL